MHTAIHAIETNLAAKTMYRAELIQHDRDVHWFRMADRNGVVWADFAPTTVHEQIQATLAMLGTQPLTWWVGAYSQPYNLGHALQQHGLTHNRDMIGMAALLENLADAEPLPDGLYFERVQDDVTLAQWQAIVTQGFRMNQAASQASYTQFASYGYEPDIPWQHFVIRDAHQVYASSSLFLSDDVVGLYNIGTAPAMRERGLGRAITLKTFEQVRGEYRIATLQTQYPNALRLYHRMGFEVYCKIGIYQRT